MHRTCTLNSPNSAQSLAFLSRSPLPRNPKLLRLSETFPGAMNIDHRLSSPRLLNAGDRRASISKENGARRLRHRSFFLRGGLPPPIDGSPSRSRWRERGGGAFLRQRLPIIDKLAGLGVERRAARSDSGRRYLSSSSALHPTSPAPPHSLFQKRFSNLSSAVCR